MAEYRLDELAAVSGVSARNIRAYRERGLLDPPRREGRSAIYDDRHLSQLRAINDLLRRGFTSAHIAEFFAATREGQDLAGVLGLRDAIFGHRQGGAEAPPLDLALSSPEARRLLAHGLAEVVGNKVTMVDPRVSEIVSAADDQEAYVRTILSIADGVAQAWEHRVLARFGPNYVPRPEHSAELRGLVDELRELSGLVVTDRLFAAVPEAALDPRVRGIAADALREPHGDDRKHGERRSDDVDDGSLVGAEQVSEDPDR